MAIPAALVLAFLRKWSADAGHGAVALVRMLVQLTLVGYVLVYIFKTSTPWPVLAVLLVMVVAASWIALRTVSEFRLALYGRALLSIALGGGATVVLVTQGVLTLDPWYEPTFMVPLAGMIFAASMNSVSLAAERFVAELRRGQTPEEAKRVAVQAGLIPIVNALLAVGLVSLPGLMTGQILSGVDPQTAVRYQVMVMLMVFGASGLSAALFLVFGQDKLLRRLEVQAPAAPASS
ncbi:MAG: ABC transporter permease [Myxococcota bacterium]